MKLLITITFFLGIPGFAALAQVPDWIWARSGGGNANDGGFAVAADPSGNVYVAGTFTSDSVAFGSIKLYTSFLMKPALFLVKYDFNGNVIWARNATGKIGYNISLAADPGGNIYVAGSFESASILFDSIKLPVLLYQGILGGVTRSSLKVIDKQLFSALIFPFKLLHGCSKFHWRRFHN